MTIQQTISRLASQCVLCAVCTPYCPTYQIFRTENESPRGRIALLKALAEEQFMPSKKTLIALDHCLGCRACEKNCPSQVDYAQLNRLGRQFIRSHYPLISHPLQQQLVEKVLSYKATQPLLSAAAKIASPVLKFFSPHSNKHSNTMSHFINEIATHSSISSALKNYYPASGDHDNKSKAQLILFTGCSSSLFEQQLLKDAIFLFNACQYDVVIPKEQNCCGALSIRQGNSADTKKLAQGNIDSFIRLLEQSQAIISLNNSCSAQLQDYKKFIDSKNAEQFSAKSFDAISFLADTIKHSPLQFNALDKETSSDSHLLGVHIPCSLKNMLREEALLFKLLDHIPGVQLEKLNDDYCCGAAGSYMLQYPDVARQLLDKKINDIARHHYHTIVSSNIGCSLHLKQGIKQQAESLGREIEVLHPLSLLARLVKR